jgi:DNA-directed RNA polymerase specialized sigma24 family protein
MEQREVLTQAGVEITAAPTLEVIFGQSYRRLVIQLYGIVGDADEAEDLVAAASVRATRDQREILASIDLEASSP